MKAAVLGLGLTKRYFDPEKFDFSIGVNDIHQYIKTDFVVCVDPPGRFKSAERRNAIWETKAEKFYTNCRQWDKVHNYEFIYTQRTPKLFSKFVGTSNNSPYVATWMAAKLGAKEITIYGADFHTDHQYFKREAPRNSAINDFKLLGELLKNYDINLYCGHRYSKLSSVLKVKK